MNKIHQLTANLLISQLNLTSIYAQIINKLPRSIASPITIFPLRFTSFPQLLSFIYFNFTTFMQTSVTFQSIRNRLGVPFGERSSIATILIREYRLETNNHQRDGCFGFGSKVFAINASHLRTTLESIDCKAIMFFNAHLTSIRATRCSHLTLWKRLRLLFVVLHTEELSM